MGEQIMYPCEAFPVDYPVAGLGTAMVEGGCLQTGSDVPSAEPGLVAEEYEIADLDFSDEDFPARWWPVS
jgi:hypothetical protein